VIIAYQSFEGRFGDSPAAVFARWRRLRPADTHVWLAADGERAGFPTGVATVPIYTPAGRELLESADVLIANTHTDTEWDKRPDAFYLQTWHGTPLKRIHHDVRWAPEGRLARLDEDVARWDALLSPNPASTPRLRAAFRFTGPVLETGYPRNDPLSGPRRQRTRVAARRRLGLPPSVTAILYTPTWRDDDVFSDRDEPSRTAAGLPAILDGLRDDEMLLYRSHSFDVARHRLVDHPRLLDVTSWPDVAELYLAADVMVTDYSSTMFDFAITGKPLLHFVPDYERFRDEVRGFYFDLAAEAPGPLLREPADLVAAIRDAHSPDRAYAARYERFRRRYTPLADGRATARVLDVLESVLLERTSSGSSRAAGSATASPSRVRS
jgi:CDP-glycerol glycerophosphotransferase